MRLRDFVLGGIAALGLGVGSAQASLSIVPLLGGAPTGAIRFNFDDLTLGTLSPQVTTSETHPTQQIQVVLGGGAAVVTGSTPNVHAAPFLSGSNGAGFGPGGGTQAAGVDTTKYLTTGSALADPLSSVTLNLPFAAKYFGILWGSVDTYNTLRFFSGSTLVGTITGVDVTPMAVGDQGVNGTFYVNITSTVAFDRVVATSNGFAFEFDNVALAVQLNGGPTGVAAPAALALLGFAVLGLAAVRRREI